jgi:outer membrane protein OmpA-like peptidoglycan-associated protein
MSSKQPFTFGASALLIAALGPGCVHTLAFSDLEPLVIIGTPPPEPPRVVVKPPLAPPPPPAAPMFIPKRVEVQKDKLVPLEPIQFENNQAAIKPQSHALLDEIVTVVSNSPQIQLLSIEGHTDNTGNAAHNQRLSEQRAAAVHDYLMQHGVATNRLSSKGWGQTRPIADNTTSAGRELNRRVEFVIVSQGPGQGEPGKPDATDDAPRAPTHIVAPSTQSEGAEDPPPGSAKPAEGETL